MANCFDVMTIRIKDERSIIIRMIVRPQSWLSVISAPGRERLGIERVHGFSIRAGEGDMRPCLRSISEANPEEGFPVGSVAREGFALGIETLNAKRTHRLVIEVSRPLNVTDANGHMIQHNDLRPVPARVTLAVHMGWVSLLAAAFPYLDLASTHG